VTRRAPSTRLTTHPYAADESVPADLNGTRYCANCALPEHHQSHTLPTTDPDTRAVTARITGEHQED
jgi:hypothetical protein